MIILPTLTCAKEKDIHAAKVMMKTCKYMIQISETAVNK